MNTSELSLDLARLEKVRHHTSGKITARCPACAEDGGDRAGNHLAIFPDGRFACAASPGDGEHRRRIFSLVGFAFDHASPPADRRVWIPQRIRERRREQTRRNLAESARTHRREIIVRHPWNRAAVREGSPQRLDASPAATDPGHFLTSLFPPEALLWTGEVHDSGRPDHATHWRSCWDWSTTVGPIGPMTTPAIWRPGTISRAAGNVASAPFTVLDFDGFDGIKPVTPAELSAHALDSLAITRWLRESMDWQLAAILWTGGKSLHAWFHTPPPDVLDSLAAVASALGMDPGLIGRPEHPCRLPGQTHAATGKTSRVLWLDHGQELFTPAPQLSLSTEL